MLAHKGEFVPTSFLRSELHCFELACVVNSDSSGLVSPVVFALERKSLPLLKSNPSTQLTLLPEVFSSRQRFACSKPSVSLSQTFSLTFLLLPEQLDHRNNLLVVPSAVLLSQRLVMELEELNIVTL